jgi:peptidoglycan/xylan/chitin deacetylase (PgdA/CDA1 family)
LANSRIRITLRRSALSFALGLLALAAAGASPAGAQTVVSLTFDDGIAHQYTVARPELDARGMLGTFFINSGRIQNGNPFFMTWSQVDALNAEHHEIGGHTIDHTVLTTVSDDEVRHQICDDAATLRGRGYQVIDFAYPGGDYNDFVWQVLGECGYVSARTFGGLRGPSCTNPTPGACPYANPIAASYLVKTLYPYPPDATDQETQAPMTYAFLHDSVVNAEANGGGWVPIVFHDICGSGGPACPANPFGPTTPNTFRDFLNFLTTERAAGRVEVKTVRNALGYPDFPPPPPPPPAKPVAADKITAFASLSIKSRQDIDKLYVKASMAEAGTLSAGGSVNTSGASKTYRFKKASARAVPGKVVKLRLRLSKKSLKAVKRALRRHRKLNAKLTITARDLVGNSKNAKRKVRLRP